MSYLIRNQRHYKSCIKSSRSKMVLEMNQSCRFQVADALKEPNMESK